MKAKNYWLLGCLCLLFCGCTWSLQQATMEVPAPKTVAVMGLLATDSQRTLPNFQKFERSYVNWLEQAFKECHLRVVPRAEQEIEQTYSEQRRGRSALFDQRSLAPLGEWRVADWVAIGWFISQDNPAPGGEREMYVELTTKVIDVRTLKIVAFFASQATHRFSQRADAKAELVPLFDALTMKFQADLQVLQMAYSRRSYKR
jgi:hypothetical protein